MVAGKINVACLGTGGIARSMSTALKGIADEVCMYAVASRSIEKAESFAKEWGYEKAYGSYEELAADEKVDLVYIATPHSEHFSNAKLCLEKGRNCIVEKAFCANRKQAKELVELAREKQLFLSEAMWTRHMPVVDEIKKLLADGVIGRIHYLESDFSVPISHVERLKNPALAGGALLDLGIYSLTMPALFLGTDVKKVITSVEKYETGVDATNIVTLVYPDGTMARTKSSFVCDHSNFARITGEKGFMEFGPTNRPEYIKIYDTQGNLLSESSVKVLVNGYEYEILAAKKAILSGEKEVKELPLSESLRMMGWMDSLRNHWGVHYPFEAKEDINISDLEAWGSDKVFDDTNPWDRSNIESFLQVYDTESKETTLLKAFPYVIEAPNWSHDGSFMVYNANGRVFRYDIASGESKEIDSGKLVKINNDHVLKFDDSEIAVSDETEAGGSRIYRVPLAGGEPVLVTEAAPSYLHGWNEDASYFCYCAERGGEYDVYSCKLDGSEEKRLTTAPKLNDGCEYDAKGEYIYFNSVRAGLMQAFRMKKDGSEQQQLTFDSNLNTWFPHISPDGSKICMLSYYKGDLWPGDHVPNKQVEIRLMQADGSDLHTVLKFFGGQGSLNVNSWSPDSKKFAFVSYKKK